MLGLHSAAKAKMLPGGPVCLYRIGFCANFVSATTDGRWWKRRLPSCVTEFRANVRIPLAVKRKTSPSESVGLYRVFFRTNDNRRALVDEEVTEWFLNNVAKSIGFPQHEQQRRQMFRVVFQPHSRYRVVYRVSIDSCVAKDVAVGTSSPRVASKKKKLFASFSSSDSSFYFHLWKRVGFSVPFGFLDLWTHFRPVPETNNNHHHHHHNNNNNNNGNKRVSGSRLPSFTGFLSTHTHTRSS